MDIEILLNRGKERLNAEELTIGWRQKCEGKRLLDAHESHGELCAAEREMKTIWLLVTMDDTEPLGEKPAVSVFSTEQLALKAMEQEINEEAALDRLHLQDVEYSEGGMFAQTKNRRFSWEISEATIQGL